MGCVKDNVMTIFEKTTTMDYSVPKRVINVYVGGRKPRKRNIQKQFEENITENIRNIFKLNEKITG